jgi:hypothetical protein
VHEHQLGAVSVALVGRQPGPTIRGFRVELHGSVEAQGHLFGRPEPLELAL